MTKWSKHARLQVLEAVIKVESERLSESSGKGVRAVSNRLSKWDRVANLLPRKLRGRTWNLKEKKLNQYKCSRLFYSLRQSYRKILGNKVRSFLQLTEPEFALFKKREGLRQTWLAARAGNALESGSANSNRGESSLGFETEQDECSLGEAASESGSQDCYEIIPQSEGHLDEHLDTAVGGHISYEMPEESEASDYEGQGRYLEQGGREAITNEEASDSEGQGRYLEQGRRDEITNYEEASDSEGQGRYLEQGEREEITNESGSLECYEILPQLAGNMEPTARDDSDSGNSVERRTSSESEELVGYVKKRRRGHLGAVKSAERLASGCCHGSPSRSTSESGDRCKFAPRTPDEARAHLRAKGSGSIVAARQPARQPRTAKSERQSISQPTSEEILDANLERPLKCLDAEFFHFSSWVKNEAIPVGRDLVTRLSVSALRSGKKRSRLNPHRPPQRIGTGPFEGLVHKSSAGMIDSRIRALFQKLRIRFAAELEKTCDDIAQEVIDGA